MYCVKCGNEMADGSAFCIHCGAAQSEGGSSDGAGAEFASNDGIGAVANVGATSAAGNVEAASPTRTNVKAIAIILACVVAVAAIIAVSYVAASNAKAQERANILAEIKASYAGFNSVEIIDAGSTVSVKVYGNGGFANHDGEPISNDEMKELTIPYAKDLAIRLGAIVTIFFADEYGGIVLSASSDDYLNPR